ncbi:helix-turn-helix transcriptional regulator [Nonomuraea longicatena]|uniref:Helix-turn-helix transcriptional regulator n=1 Tax=Nonomuraea longicatena TaxID=83682 RepID=A0ABP3ZPF6_9ACTN
MTGTRAPKERPATPPADTQRPASPPAAPASDPCHTGRPAPPPAVPRHTPAAFTGARPLRPGGAIDAHRHDDHQIAYPRTGVISVTTDAGTWVAAGDRALWIPAGTVHEHRAYGRTDLHLIGLTDNPLGLLRPTLLAVTPLVRELIVTCSQEPGDPLARALLLSRLRPSPGRPVHLPAPRDPRLAAVLALLDADPSDPRPLAGFALAAGTSERTLTRLCRDELGMTFPQWRTRLRLHHALVLLADGAPVTTVAHRCGWSSASAFIDVYRRAFGHTPGRAFTK